MGALSHASDGKKTDWLSPKEKQLFTQMQRRTEVLDWDAYCDILRRVLAPSLQGVKAESAVCVKALEIELKEFFKRYECLNWQITPLTLRRRDVLWALAHRFFVPWVALRIAFSVEDDATVRTPEGDCWFIPREDDRTFPCVMKVVDRFVRNHKELNAALAQRICARFPSGLQKDRALSLQGNLSKYSKFKTTPTDETLEHIVASSPSIPNLRLMLVLARFIDRCVKGALNEFGPEATLELVNFAAVCFEHFHAVVDRVRSEMRSGQLRASFQRGGVEIEATEAEKAWLCLSSPNFTGNSPGQWARFRPLTDRFVNEIPRQINAELRQTLEAGKRRPLPRDMMELDAGKWGFPERVALPEEIECFPYRATVADAVKTSRMIFRGKVSIPKAQKALWCFQIQAMTAFRALAESQTPDCSAEDATLSAQEAKRLFGVLQRQAHPRQKLANAYEFLKFLIEPFLPKSAEDGELARRLFTVVERPLRVGNRCGAAEYLDGCLCALEGDERAALKRFSKARKLGHESVGEFWPDLLRVGLITSQRVQSKRERRNFEKSARLLGVFSSDPTPRTNELKARMDWNEFQRVWTVGFKPFTPP